ncbi:MAG: nitronate monooxygenase [Desulfosarcina sp.]|nr:nitronate monooxygenase [Desulfosarcina sp.]
MGQNRICELLGIKYPIIQAPMNWVSGADLVAAVSNAGGLGTLGPNAGAEKITSDVELTAERMRAQIKPVWMRSSVKVLKPAATRASRS